MTDASWPQKHVDRLKAMWREGLSASQIAHRLNTEFNRSRYSRNAVIGKARRLGLDGRASAAPSRRTHAPVVARARQTMPKGVGALILPELGTGGSGLEKSVEAAKANAAAKAAALISSATLSEPPGRCVLLTLGPHMCRWPIGDPQSAAFSFCGVKHGLAGPYCEDHAARAYSPQATKVRLDTRLGITPGRRAG